MILSIIYSYWSYCRTSSLTFFSIIFLKVINTTKLFAGWSSWRPYWRAYDNHLGIMEESLHVAKRLAALVSWLNREGRTFPRDSLCALCWSCNHTMATSSGWSCDSCLWQQLCSGALWRHHSLSGMSIVCAYRLISCKGCFLILSVFLFRRKTLYKWDLRTSFLRYLCLMNTQMTYFTWEKGPVSQGFIHAYTDFGITIY